MTPQEVTKLQNALWWIISIAVSVLCCSVLFILFASYLVEIKSDIRDENMRINLIEQREDKILAEIETLRKHDAPSSQTSSQTPAAPSEEGVNIEAPGAQNAGSPPAVTVPVTVTIPSTVPVTDTTAVPSAVPAEPSPVVPTLAPSSTSVTPPSAVSTPTQPR